MDPLLTGRAVWDLLDGVSVRYMRTVEDDHLDPETLRLADEFLDAAGDWSEISDDVRAQGFPAVREAQQNLDAQLKELLGRGVYVYGRRVNRTITGGGLEASAWPTAHIAVLGTEELRERGGFDGA